MGGRVGVVLIFIIIVLIILQNNLSLSIQKIKKYLWYNIMMIINQISIFENV